MLRLVSDILKADCDPSVLDDPSVLKIDHLGLCELLLDLLQWQLQMPPDPVPSVQRALMNAWRATLERLSDAIKMADGPAANAEAEVISRIITMARTLPIPPDLKLDKPMDALISALAARSLGPQVLTAFRNWKLLPRTRTSMNESVEAIALQQDSVISLSRDVDSQIHDNDDLSNGATNGTVATDGNSSA